MRTSPGWSRRARRTVAHLLQGPHPAFVPRPPGLNSGADPDLFLGQLLVELGPLPGLGLQHGLLAAQIGLVVARPARQPAAVEVENARGQLAQQHAGRASRIASPRRSAAETLPASGSRRCRGDWSARPAAGCPGCTPGPWPAARGVSCRPKASPLRRPAAAHARKDRLDLLVHAPAAVDLQGVLDAVRAGRASSSLSASAAPAGRPLR